MGKYIKSLMSVKINAISAVQLKNSALGSVRTLITIEHMMKTTRNDTVGALNCLVNMVLIPVKWSWLKRVNVKPKKNC